MVFLGRNIPEDFKENGIDKSYDEIFGLICQNIKIKFNNERFVYFIDENYVFDSSKGYRWENLTPNYSKIVENGLNQIKYKSEELSNNFCKSYNSVLDYLILLANRIISELQNNYPERVDLITSFEAIKNKPASGFEEAIQRMLFINQLFWQMDHRLTGLGAWDSILEPFYKADLENGKIDKEKALEILRDLFRILHGHYEYKSNVLMGDTGQIFVIGKTDENGQYVCNDLTYLFIDAMRLEHLSEPKCLLRVNRDVPRDLIETSLKAIETGIGAPLLANDDIVIPQLLEFGLPIEDACNYTTSACWEPLVGGKSSSMNNMTVLNYLKALDNLFRREKLEDIKTYDELVDKYIVYLRRNLNAVKRVLEPHRFQYNPLLSVFMDDCRELKKDVSQGGARYHNVGITSVAMGNLVNSLLNIREYVYEKKELTLFDVKNMVINNFEGFETIKDELKNKPSLYGKDEKEIIDLVNRITQCVSEEIKDWRSYLGGRMKVGLSGSAYLDAGKGFDASFDARKEGDPFVTHISNDDNVAFTEIVNFSANLKYCGNRFNGNVIDYMVSPSFISNNRDKFVDFLMASIKVGFFEMQMNVVSSQTLIDARNNPLEYPNLIVRVWGFSAYFNELPDDYKEVLISRALRNEGKSVVF